MCDTPQTPLVYMLCTNHLALSKGAQGEFASQQPHPISIHAGY